MVSDLSVFLWNNMAYVIFSILASDSFTFIPCLPIPSQKFRHCSQYEFGMAFFSTIYGPFVLNSNFCSTPYFILDLICFLSTKMSPSSIYLMILPLLRRSLILSLISETRMLNISLCINRSGDVASKWSKF